MTILGDALHLDYSLAHVMITDPPYRGRVHRKGVTLAGGIAHHNDLGFSSLTDGLRNHIGMMAYQIPYWSLIYSDTESSHLWLQSTNAEHIRTMAWVRWSMPQLTGDRPPQGFEVINVFWGSAKGAKAWNGPGNLVAFTDKCLRGGKKHKTQKPLSQALSLVSYFSDPGFRVVDPCAGRGTTGVACALLERPFIGSEINPVEAALADLRIAAALDGQLDARDLDSATQWAYDRITDSETHLACSISTAPSRARALRVLRDAEGVLRRLNAPTSRTHAAE